MKVFVVTENIGNAYEEYRTNRKVFASEEAAEAWIETRWEVEKTHANKFDVEEWEVE